MTQTNRHQKYLASLSIEELAEQAKPYQQNWLLTYLDVFVLIVMLFVTLMSVNDFKMDKILVENNTHTPGSQTINPSTALENPTEHDDLIADQTFANISENFEQQQEPSEINDNNLAKPQTTLIKQADNTTLTKSDTFDLHLDHVIKDLDLSDSVAVNINSGFAELEIQNKILFDSSEAGLMKEGMAVLKKLTPVLEQSLGLIVIEGHTDDRPIKTPQFPSNWELAASRATNVVHFLTEQGISPFRLRATSSGSTRPIADNATEQGRKKNRRVSIIIQIREESTPEAPASEQERTIHINRNNSL